MDNTLSTIDSRDVIARIAELENRGRGDDSEELAALRALALAGEDASEDWPHGATLIRDSYFEEYARAMAQGIGINVEARKVQSGYTAIGFGGITYWIR